MTEAWLAGPIDGVAPALMPAAHALAQVVIDVEAATRDLDERQLYARPGGAASLAFQLMHLAGSTDRLMTYARGEMLDERQREALDGERTVDEARPPLAALLAGVRAACAAATDQLRRTSVDSLAEPRAVGRARLPSTVLGLLFHAAEHASRHAGQVITTAKIVKSGAVSAGTEFAEDRPQERTDHG